MNYTTIKELAKANGHKVNDLLALTSCNDPFYVGQPAEVEKAKWFAEVWHSGILGGRNYLRGIHYFMVSQKTPIPMPNGMPYENTDQCWGFLTQSSKVARYLDLIDPRAFKDKKNQPPQIFTREEEIPTLDIEGRYYFDLELPDFPELPDYRLKDFSRTQNFMTEIWIEKSSMEEELLSLCKHYGCNLVTGVGELSISQVIFLIDRIIKYERPCRILYVSDFDPAGCSMPVAVSRKVEFYQRTKHPDLNIQIQQIALTHDQCRKYELPRTPIKESEKRIKKFEAQYGEGATELDALEANYPGELAKILRKELSRFYDDTLDERVYDAAREFRNELEDLRDTIADQYAYRIEELQMRYEKIKDNFEVEVAEIAGLVEGTWHAITEQMEEDMPEIPSPPKAIVDRKKAWVAPLYASDRDYMKQLDHYNKFKKGKGSKT